MNMGDTSIHKARVVVPDGQGGVRTITPPLKKNQGDDLRRYAPDDPYDPRKAGPAPDMSQYNGRVK
jgi:hypothetical protein